MAAGWAIAHNAGYTPLLKVNLELHCAVLLACTDEKYPVKRRAAFVITLAEHLLKEDKNPH